MKIKKFLVTGATGFIGRELVPQIEATGASTLAMARSKQDNQSVEFIQQDFNEKLNLNLSTLESVDCVFHLAGIAHAESGKYGWDDYYRVNTQATSDLVEAVGQVGVKKFILVSSVKACADPGDECVDETWEKEPEDYYGKSKRLAEQAVVEISNKYNMEYVIVRPTLVYGPNIKGNLLKMISAIEAGKFPPIPDVNNKRSLVHVSDLCKALILVASKNEASGNTYIISDQKQYSTRDIYDIMSDALGRPKKRFYIPKSCFYAAAKMGNIFETVFDKKLPLNSEGVKKLFGSACYNSSKIAEQTGFKPEFTLSSAMPAIVKAYRDTLAS